MNTTLIEPSLELNTFGEEPCIDVLETRIVASIKIDEAGIVALFDHINEKLADVRKNPPDAGILLQGHTYWLFRKSIEALRKDLKDYLDASI